MLGLSECLNRLDPAFDDEERNFEIQRPERRPRLEDAEITPEVYVQVAE